MSLFSFFLGAQTAHVGKAWTISSNVNAETSETGGATFACVATLRKKSAHIFLAAE